MPSRASNSSLRMAQFQTPVRCQSQSVSWRSCVVVRRSLSCRWITLHPFLVLDVLLDNVEWRTTNGGNKVGVGPQRGQSRTEPGIFLAQETGRTAFHRTDQAMNAVLGVNLHEEMDVFRHSFQFQNLGMEFSTHALDNLFKTYINPVDQHGTTILR